MSALGSLAPDISIDLRYARRNNSGSLAIFTAICRALSGYTLPNKRESKGCGNGKHEIAQQQKWHQSCQLIGFCHVPLHVPTLAYRLALWRGRLIEKGRDAKKTIAIATAYPIRSAVIVVSKWPFSQLGRCQLI
jgi:hypothetical protein